MMRVSPPFRPFAARAAAALWRLGRRLCGVLLMSMAWVLPFSVQAQQAMHLDQGDAWTTEARQAFYARDQGSQIIPLRWMAALKQSNGRPFLADNLSRYGYLSNPDSDPPGLPVGFTTGGSGPNGTYLGMTCAACHTRQIEAEGVLYRIDGGPAMVDFQSFLSDLDQAVQAVLDQPAVFKDFAAGVLGPKAPPPKLLELRTELAAWHKPYHTLIQRSLPTPAWGPGRLDVMGMVVNRLTGLGLGPPPTYLIADNIQKADAPVRYPFLWNAAAQDKTLWPGFADNGSALLGLSRNLGQVLGMFASFRPRQDYWKVLGVDYLHENSADFGGLRTLEDLMGKIGPPKWPWKVDVALAVQGEAIFARNTAQGGCADCHGIKPGATRFPDQKTWATPLHTVGTDTREHAVLNRQVQTGSLLGAKTPFIGSPLKPVEPALNVLGTAVLGSLLQHYAPLTLDTTVMARSELSRVDGALEKAPSLLDPKQVQELRGAFPLKGPGAATPATAYKARVLMGVWAAAPYLHNGSVPTLAELLKPVEQRVSEFKVGPNYDLQNVGLAVTQTRFNHVLKTTDCSKPDSGNSRCGHEFGTKLPAEEKRALLEYLKTL